MRKPLCWEQINEWGLKPPLRTCRLNKTMLKKTPKDGEMNEKTLPSRHIILNSSPGGLRLSTLPLGHGDNIESLRVSGEETLCFFEITL